MAIKSTVSGGTHMAAALEKIAKQLGNGKLLRVGFLETEKYPDGTNVAQVAFWNEYGTKTAPPRPFFRSMIAKKKAGWGPALGRLLVQNAYDVDKAMKTMGLGMSEQVVTSIIDTNAPPLSDITLMLRKMRIGKTDAKTTGAMVGEAARRVAAGESTAGINAKPLIYTHEMETSVGYDIKNGSAP